MNGYEVIRATLGIISGLGNFAHLGVLVCAVSAMTMLAGPVMAQSLNNAFGGMSENSDQPIDIEADTLTVFDAKKYATFKGNVRAVQGTTILRASELNVHYVGGAKTLTGQGGEPEAAAVSTPEAKGAEGSPESKINKIEARGEVVITSEDDQTTTSDWAIYDVPAQLITVGGNVVLSQDQNVLKGDRLVINLATGESRFDNTGTSAAGGGRIRALFMPKEASGGKPKEGGGKPKEGDAKPNGASPTWGAGGDATAGPAPQLPGGAAENAAPVVPAAPVREYR